jgi:LAO/AO transport system kinase
MADPVDDVHALIEAARDGQPRAVARLISLAESGLGSRRALAAALGHQSPRAAVVGVTGPPGVGKSTLTSALVARWRARGERVGVLAVDPTSPLSGGALLGDRVRMHEHATDPGVFVRSLASRGHHGGLAVAVPLAVRVLDAAGCDVIVIETVGVGQAEFEIAALADSTVLVLVPGYGDAIQAAKAGVLEVADLIVVNKADLEGSEQVVRELRMARGHQPPAEDRWPTAILRTAAARDEGIAEVVDAVAEHGRWLAASGELSGRRRARLRAEIEAIVVERVRAGLDGNREVLDGLADRIAAGEADPYSVAEEMAREHLSPGNW